MRTSLRPRLLFRGFWLLTLTSLACSTPREKDLTITPAHASRPITYGRMAQALLVMLNIKDGGDMVDRGGAAMMAHVVSLFYGVPYDEMKQNEEQILLDFCRREFPSPSLNQCASRIFRDMTTQASQILVQYEKLVSFRKDASDLRNHILAALIEGAPFSLNQVPTLRFGDQSPQLAPTQKGTLLKRLPRGLAFVIDKEKAIAGDLFKASLDNFEAFIPLFIRAASFEEGQELSIIGRKDTPLKKLLPLLAMARQKGVNAVVVWGRQGGLSRGLKISLAFTPDKDASTTPHGVNGASLTTMQSLIHAMARAEKPLTLLLKRPLKSREKKIEPLFHQIEELKHDAFKENSLPPFKGNLGGGFIEKME